MPMVSVVIPTYNSAPYLQQTLDSVLRQEGVELEVILVDDASTDDTAALVAGYSSPNLRYIALPANHGGPSRPRNVGVQAAKGEFIAFFDSDDLMLPGHLRRSLRFLVENAAAGLVFSRALRLSSEGKLAPSLPEHVFKRFYRLRRQPAGEGGWLLNQEDAFECLFWENFILPSGVVMPRQVLEEVGPFDETLTNGDDRDIWFRVARRRPLGFIEAYGFYYRVRGGSISGRGVQLAENRIRVLRQLLATPLPPRARLGARRLVAENLYGIGYTHQLSGNRRDALLAYLASLRTKVNLTSVRGLASTLLPAGCRQLAQARRRKSTAGGEGELVSVVVTCFNYGRYLAGCLESVLGQTYRHLEIVVVNDGSTDATDEVMAPFLADQRILYIRQENRGQAAAKNIGVAHARGALIAFLDADDRWAPDKLARQVPLFAGKETGVVYSRARFIDGDGQNVDFKLSGRYLMPRAGRVSDFLFLDNFVPFSSSVVRRECFERVGYFDESLAMGIDWDLWLRISVFYRFEFVDAPLLVYRLGHAGQMSRNLEQRQSCSERIMTGFLERHPGALSPATIRKARAYTCCNRGNHYRHLDRPRSTRYFQEAIRQSPGQIGAYLGLLKNLLNV